MHCTNLPPHLLRGSSQRSGFFRNVRGGVVLFYNHGVSKFQWGFCFCRLARSSYFAVGIPLPGPWTLTSFMNLAQYRSTVLLHTGHGGAIFNINSRARVYDFKFNFADQLKCWIYKQRNFCLLKRKSRGINSSVCSVSLIWNFSSSRNMVDFLH